MNGTSIPAHFTDAQTQANTKEAAEAAIEALESLYAVSPGAAGLVAHSATAYFDGITKLALVSQAILLKEMAHDLADTNPHEAAEDALGALATDIFMGAAAAIAAAAGALEAASADFAVDRIDQSIAKYSELRRKGGV
ncbi:RebB family R body protein [Lysobacter sp. CA199]|uniref:RebB family R body protein n=1 Tax=Lysobacter sp. CA199 TaxID=3455608 RepID=UPI003F8D4971